MHKSDLIIPIRTRGTLSALARENNPGLRVRTRGGATAAMLDTKSVSLHAVIEDLRKVSRSIPLTTVIHGWGTEVAEQFYKALLEYLWREDRIWLVPAKAPASRGVPIMEDAILLDLSKNNHSRVYENLAVDIAFFTAMEDTEIELVKKRRNRTQVVIMGSGGQLTQLLAKASFKAEGIYYWAQGELTNKF